jgi:hypothetical protein
LTTRDDVKAVLEADGTLMALLTGGVYAGGTINRQDTAGAFDGNKEIRPCALVNAESQAPAGPFKDSAREVVRVFFYERSGYDAIDQAIERVYVLLHRQKVGASGWIMLHAGDVTDQVDQALDCSLAVSRYYKHRMRQ